MPLVLGHRGCAGLESENTVRAFRKALDLEVDLIEFDVRMTRDGELVVIHDPKVDRTTNGKSYVRDFTFGEIRKLNAGKNKKIPSLKEAIELLKKEKPVIVIEIKEPETTEKILKIIKKRGLEDNILIVSFWHDVLKKIKKITPGIKTGAILAGRPIDLVSIAKTAKLNFLCLRYEFIDEKVVRECHKNGIKINAWTVNENEDIERVIKLGVDIISSDHPDRVLAKLKK